MSFTGCRYSITYLTRTLCQAFPSLVGNTIPDYKTRFPLSSLDIYSQLKPSPLAAALLYVYNPTTFGKLEDLLALIGQSYSNRSHWI